MNEVRNLLNYYINVYCAKREWTSATIKTKYYRINRFIDEMDIKWFSDITTELFDQWTDSLFERGLCANTRNTEVQTIRAFLVYATRNRGYQIGVDIYEIRRNKPSQIDRTAYSDDDVQRIIGACNNSRERILMILILRGALRRIEIAKLRKEDINGRELEFLAKGGDRRKALIPEWAADEVRSYCSTTSGPWMFPSPFKKCRGKHVNTSTLSSWANDIAKRAGFDTFKTHSGRYSLATEMYRRGANIRSIQSQLGHKSQRTTELYIQRIDELVMADYDRCFA